VLGANNWRGDLSLSLQEIAKVDEPWADNVLDFFAKESVAHQAQELKGAVEAFCKGWKHLHSMIDDFAGLYEKVNPKFLKHKGTMRSLHEAAFPLVWSLCEDVYKFTHSTVDYYQFLEDMKIMNAPHHEALLFLNGKPIYRPSTEKATPSRIVVAQDTAWAKQFMRGVIHYDLSIALSPAVLKAVWAYNHKLRKLLVEYSEDTEESPDTLAFGHAIARADYLWWLEYYEAFKEKLSPAFRDMWLHFLLEYRQELDSLDCVQ